MKSVLLVVDVQQGLCEGPESAFDCDAIIRRINRVAQKAREAGVPVVFIQHEEESGKLLYGSDPWQLAEGLEAKTTDHYIRKTTPDSFLRTELMPFLEERGITHLTICGMYTEFCVDTTTRRALGLGFPVTLISDAHTSAGNPALSPEQVIMHHNVTLSSISSFGPRVTPVPSEDVTFSS